MIPNRPIPAWYSNRAPGRGAPRFPPRLRPEQERISESDSQVSCTESSGGVNNESIQACGESLSNWDDGKRMIGHDATQPMALLKPTRIPSGFQVVSR